MDTPPGGPPAELPESWETLMNSMKEIDEDYLRVGWSTVVLHPGSVVTYPADHEEVGFVLVVANNEFADLKTAIDGEPESFDTFDVYRRAELSMVFLILAIEDSDRQVVLLMPAYYDATDDPTFEERAESAGHVTVTVRTLNDDGPSVSFVHENPDPFFPAESLDT